MKHLIIVLFIVVLGLLFHGCGTNSDLGTDAENPTITTIERTEPIGLFGTEDFSDAVRDNPIDKAFYEIEFDGSTLYMIELNCRFRDYWETEIDSTIEKLYKILREDDAKILKKAQNSWDEFMKSNYSFRQTLFYEDSLFNEESYGVADGTLDRGIMNSVQMEETRRRALELMEYLYRFTGKIEFAFSNAD